MIGAETEKKRAAKRPAVVPPITLTSAKITIAVKEPNTTGNIMVKS
jgi:hypothetical protein